MGSRAPLILAWRGGEPQDPRDPGPRLATCSTGDNYPRTSSALWSLHHCLYPSCAPKLSPARASLGRLGFRDSPRSSVGSWWVRSTGEGDDWGSETRCQSAAWRPWARRRSGRPRRGESGRGLDHRALQGGLRTGSRRHCLSGCSGLGPAAQGRVFRWRG